MGIQCLATTGYSHGTQAKTHWPVLSGSASHTGELFACVFEGTPALFEVEFWARNQTKTERELGDNSPLELVSYRHLHQDKSRWHNYLLSASKGDDEKDDENQPKKWTCSLQNILGELKAGDVSNHQKRQKLSRTPMGLSLNWTCFPVATKTPGFRAGRRRASASLRHSQSCTSSWQLGHEDARWRVRFRGQRKKMRNPESGVERKAEINKGPVALKGKLKGCTGRNKSRLAGSRSIAGHGFVHMSSGTTLIGFI